MTTILPLRRDAPTVPPHHEPHQAKVCTSDLGHFWTAFDRASAMSCDCDRILAFREEYYFKASLGLQDFIRLSVGDAFSLVNAIRRRPRYYGSTRHAMRIVEEAGPRWVYDVFDRWKDLHTTAIFPDVYFVVGRLAAGGISWQDKILIGTEMFARADDSPDDELHAWHQSAVHALDAVPSVIAHELVHANQRLGGARNLLADSIREGSADFLGSLVAGSHLNRRLHKWAAPREAGLWAQFRSEMHLTDTSRWLRNGAVDSSGWPADLGYFVGYRIAEAYYKQALDKPTAVVDILTIRDFDAFLAASRYGELTEASH